jgi:class 3 adenylate cyclase
MVWGLLALVAAAASGWTVWSQRRTLALERRLQSAARDLEFLQRAFARFAPAEVIEDIIAGGVSTHSAKKEITVLFADLKGFTPLSETLDPSVLVRILNGYFERMSRVIDAHRGHVAKFIGDGLLALFGALDVNPWQTNDAVHAALAMRAALAEYNTALAADGLPPLAVGIGIHRGQVIAGVMGSEALMEYGVVGRTVNLASRVEGLTRIHDVDILLTDAVRATLDPRFRLRAMPAVEVRGLGALVESFAVEGFDAVTPVPA